MIHLSLSTLCLPIHMFRNKTILDHAFVVLSPYADASQYLYYK